MLIEVWLSNRPPIRASHGRHDDDRVRFGDTRSLIAPPSSTGLFCRVLPSRGHGSLRGRRMPPQHLVRSTGAAMSTTGSRAVHAAQGPLSQSARTLAPEGNSHSRQPVARMDCIMAWSRARWPLGPTERLARPPDAMQNHRQLPRQRYARFPRSGSLGDGLRPIFQSGCSLDPRQDHHRCLIQKGPRECVAALRNTAAAINFARLILPRRQTHVRPTDRDRAKRAGSSTVLT